MSGRGKGAEARIEREDGKGQPMYLRFARFVGPWLMGLVLLLGTMSCVIEYHTGGSESGAVHHTTTVQATRAWSDTGIFVARGQVLSIRSVSGDWSPWPGGHYDALGSGGDPRCDCNVILGVSHAALIGRIGAGEPFLVGDDYSSVVGEQGQLWLGINDRRLEDNSGQIVVSVQVR
jgi:hypothetical protein